MFWRVQINCNYSLVCMQSIKPIDGEYYFYFWDHVSVVAWYVTIKIKIVYFKTAI